MEKTLLSLAFILLLGSIYHFQSTSSVQNDVPEEVVQQFNSWKVANNKKYGSMEEQYRLNVFYQNYQTVEESNADETKTYKLGMNQFADLSQEEFVGIYLFEEPQDLPEVESTVSSTSNDSVDWKDRVRVKNQGRCGSCWAFGTTGAIEAYYSFKVGQEVNVSEQYLVDCARNGNMGCNGGLAPYALDYVTQNGIPDEDAYPYKAVQSTCQKSDNRFKINGKQFVGGTEEGLRNALKNYPVSVSVDATNWHLYKEGVFSNCDNQITNHAVLAVGYEESGNWIVRNSWGTSWGEKGFIRLVPGNTCKILYRTYIAV